MSAKESIHEDMEPEAKISLYNREELLERYLQLCKFDTEYDFYLEQKKSRYHQLQKDRRELRKRNLQAQTNIAQV